MDKEQIHKGYEAVMERLLVTGWLKKFTFTENKGFRLAWTTAGAQKACLLKAVIDLHGLLDDCLAPMSFDNLWQGGSLPSFVRPAKIEPEIRTLWCESIEQAGIDRTEDGLLFFVHVISGWAPDENTGIEFGF